MSYTNVVEDLAVHVICAAAPQKNYEKYYKEIENKVRLDRYEPKTSMDNLIKNVILCFDCDDNYGEYDPVTGFGGYGKSFTLGECFRYVEESGGWAEFDYET